MHGTLRVATACAILAGLLAATTAGAGMVGNLVDKAMDKAIDAVDPTADADSRAAAKSAAKFSHSVTDEQSQRNWDDTKAAVTRSAGGAGSGSAGREEAEGAGSGGGRPAAAVVASADLPLVCPKDGERYPADFAFCPKHGVKLEPAGGSRTDRVTEPVTGLELVRVEGGCVIMGDDKGGAPRNPPTKCAWTASGSGASRSPRASGRR